MDREERSKINRKNATTHGYSNDPLYPEWRRLKLRHLLVCAEWLEGGLKRWEPKPGLARFVRDIEETIGRPRDKRMNLEVIEGSTDRWYRRGNVEWVVPWDRDRIWAVRALRRKIKTGEIGADRDDQVTCWDAASPCEFSYRWDCRCVVGMLTRQGLSLEEIEQELGEGL